MEKNHKKIATLLEKYANNICTRGELDELFMYIGELEDNEILHTYLQVEWSKVKVTTDESINEPDWKQMLNSIIGVSVKKPSL